MSDDFKPLNLDEDFTFDALLKQASEMKRTRRLNATEMITQLSEMGVSQEDTTRIIDVLYSPANVEVDDSAKKDILWGAIWCFGGIAATLADFGFIFWGAILFGGIQLVRGIINSQ